MLKFTHILIFCWLAASAAAQTPKTLAVLGSSTSACYGFGGGISDTNCWVNRVKNYYNANGYSITLYNLAVSGYNVYQGMPTGYPGVTIGGGTYSPDPAHNVTAALAVNPDVVIVNYPSNVYDVANVHDILSYYRVIFEKVVAAGKTCFITTTQPRTTFNQAGRNNLIELKDSLLKEYGYYSLDFWNLFAEPDGSIDPVYGQGDGIHLNAMAHDTLRWRTVAKDIFNAGCLNLTVASGNWNNPAVWITGAVPGDCDSAVVRTGNSLTLFGNARARVTTIASGASLNLANPLAFLQVGATGAKNSIVRVSGTLSLSDGSFQLSGRLELESGSTFQMTGGQLTIDGNTGSAAGSIADGESLLSASGSMSIFSFTGGTLTFINPPWGASSETLNCSYPFGPNSILALGNGISTLASQNSNGFGGMQFPGVIGKLVLDAATSGSNRIFRVVKPLTVQSPLQVLSGQLIQEAALTVAN